MALSAVYKTIEYVPSEVAAVYGRIVNIPQVTLYSNAISSSRKRSYLFEINMNNKDEILFNITGKKRVLIEKDYKYEYPSFLKVECHEVRMINRDTFLII
jgi:hypothetical protein